MEQGVRMGVGEALLLALVIGLAFWSMLRQKTPPRNGGGYIGPAQNDDIARIRQMKEWDRFDDSKSGKS